MKLICERDVLHRALSAVRGRVSKDKNIPILQHLRLTAHDNKLTITATDLTTRAESTCAAEVAMAGATCVSAERLAHVIGGMASGAQISIHLDKGELHVRSGSARYRFSTMPREDFPDFSELRDPIEFSLPCLDVKALFADPQGAIKLSGGRLMLEGGFFHQREPGKLAMVGCDGTMLICRSILVPSNIAPQHIVPKAAMIEIAKLAGEGEIHFRISQNAIEASAGSITFTSKLIDATYPGIEQLIGNLGQSILVDRHELLEAIKRLTALEAEKSYLAIAWRGPTEPLEISLTGYGSGIEELRCECEFTEAGRVLFASSVLTPLLAVIKGDAIRLYPRHESQMRIVDPGDGDLIALGMPIRDREAHKQRSDEDENNGAD